MTNAEGIAVRKHVIVNAPVERAFAVFTERFDDIKPHSHNLLAAPVAEVVFEPRVGGNIYDRAVDGTECRWARVLAFEPPHRVMFRWDIAPNWQLEDDPANGSEVEVTFTAVSDSRTRVDLEHRKLENHGPDWRSLADGVAGENGWPLYLDRYAALF